ncbi:MAG: YciI family protein [Bryobacteraceae bacterium]|nr:YciI family protein [Bryobacteraceae bacterium]
MQYLILIYGNERSWVDATPEQAGPTYAEYMKYSRELAEAGVLRGGAELQPTHTARTLRAENGKIVTTDGPFAETREQLGGYYLIDVATEQEAQMWAAKCPGVHAGSIEVRATAAQASAGAA